MSSTIEKNIQRFAAQTVVFIKGEIDIFFYENNGLHCKPLNTYLSDIYVVYRCLFTYSYIGCLWTEDLFNNK